MSAFGHSSSATRFIERRIPYTLRDCALNMIDAQREMQAHAAELLARHAPAEPEEHAS